MSMDPEYQTKDPTYDAVNKKLIIGMVLLAAAIIAVWYYAHRCSTDRACCDVPRCCEPAIKPAPAEADGG